jgi:hypothetical protein
LIDLGADLHLEPRGSEGARNATAHGALHTASGDLAALTGRPATTLSAAVGAALRALDGS